MKVKVSRVNIFVIMVFLILIVIKVFFELVLIEFEKLEKMVNVWLGLSDILSTIHSPKLKLQN